MHLSWEEPLVLRICSDENILSDTEVRYYECQGDLAGAT